MSWMSNNRGYVHFKKKRKITNIESFKMSDVPHFFPTKDSIIAYNNNILEQSPGESITVIAIGSPPTDITHSMQEQILIAAHKKDVNSTGKLFINRYWYILLITSLSV